MTNITAPLKLREKISYGMGDLGSNLVFQGLSFFILIYWTNEALISPTVAGTILLLSRLFDGVTDVFFGRLVDKTNSKHGKARPWLLWLAIPFALSAMGTFWTPLAGGYWDIIYAFVSYNVTMTVYTAINIPYGVLTAKITADPVERGYLGIFRSLGSLSGVMLVAVIAPMLIDLFDYSIAFLIIGVLASTCIFFTFLGTKERVGNDENTEDIGFKNGLKVLFNNKAWVIMLLGCIIFFTAFTARTTATAYYATYILTDAALVGTLTMVGLPGMVIGLMCSAYFFKKFGKVKTTVYSSYFYSLLTLAFYFLSTSSIESLYVYLGVTSMCLGIGTAGLFPMIADTIEYGEWKTGQRIEGLTYSAASIGTKIGGGFGAAMVGWILGYYGFNANTPEQSVEILNAIEALYLWLPGVGLAVFAFILNFNDADRCREQIVLSLQERQE